MRVTIDAATLAGGLRRCLTGKNLEVLQHALFHANDGRLRITSQDLEKQICFSLDCETQEEGKATVAPGSLRQVLNGLQEEVTLFSAENQLTLQQENGRATRQYDLPSLPAQDFPLLDTGEQKDWGVDLAALRSAIARVEYAAGVKEFRPALNGVFIGRDCVAASDGHRIASVPLKTGKGEMIVPTGSVKPLLDFLKDAEAPSAFACPSPDKPRYIGFSAGGDELCLRLVDAVYFEIKRFFDEAKDACVLRFDRQEAISVCGRMIAVNTKSTQTAHAGSIRSCPLVIVGESGSVRSGQSCFDVIDSLEADGKVPEVCVNAYYLRDALSAMDGAQQAELRLTGPVDQVFLRPDEGDDIHVIMPMKE